MLIEFIGIEAASVFPFELILPPHFARVQLVLGPVLRHLLQHRRRHVLVRQLLEDLLRTLRHVARSGKDEGHGSDGRRHHPQGDLVAGVPNALTRVVRVPVVVSWPDVHEWRVVTQGQHPQPDSVQNVDHAGNPGKLTEGHDALAVLVAHPLVVNQTDVLLQQRVQQVHILLLGLDGVGEEAEGLVPLQAVDGHLFDAENDRRFRDVLLYESSCLRIQLHRIRAPVGGLDQDLDAILDQLPDMSRAQRSSSFPNALVFPGK